MTSPAAGVVILSVAGGGVIPGGTATSGWPGRTEAGWCSGIAFIPLMLNVTKPKPRTPDDWIVNTLVVGFPITKGNVWPALKKYTLIGAPIGRFVSEKANGGGPVWLAVSVCARMAFVVAWTTLMIVPDTDPEIVTVPADGVG